MSRDLKRALLLPLLLATTGARAGAAADADHGEPRIGPWRVIEELGSGGMGSVFLCERRDPIARRAAVKVARRDDDAPELAARFLVERQLLALVEHENIVKLIDAGATERGDAWFAMEHVDGEPITDYCDARRLDLATRLALFAEVCDAVQHLHARGIEHRDLKPDNVLVVERDGRAVPKLIDLGLAVVRGHDTGDDGLGGTLTHMAPEQFTRPSADVDQRADVHALGVMLYELLIGALPFPPATGGHDVVVARDGDPPPPSARWKMEPLDRAAVAGARGSDERRLLRALEGGLDRVAHRAVAADRERRFADAGELASAVRDRVARDAMRASVMRAAPWLAGAFIAGALLGLAL